MTKQPRTGAALITGAGQRVGKHLAGALAKAGYDIAVHYRSSDKGAKETAKSVETAGRMPALVQADLSDRKDVAALIANANEALGPLSVLINCASLFEQDSLEDFTDDSWSAHFDVNLYAPAKLAQTFAAQAEAGANNVVINIIDQRVLKLTPQFFSYTLTKSALWTATRTMAQALGPAGIRVNGVSPGPVLKNARQSDADWEKQNASTILGRGAKPADVASAALYLINAPAVTGQMIVADGGQHLVWQTPDVLVNE